MRCAVLTGLCAGLLAAPGCKDRIDPPAISTEQAVGATSVPAILPADVAAFIERRTGCDHFRGEDPYDAERAAFLADRIRQLCSGSDAALAWLRQTYAQDKAAIAALARFDPIE